MRVELHWTSHGVFAFELTGLLKKTDMSTASLAVPPTNAVYENTPFPVAGVASMLTSSELATFRNIPSADPPAGAPAEGIVVANGADELRVFYIDGVPAVWAAPGARDVLHLPRGRYVLQWRRFSGTRSRARSRSRSRPRRSRPTPARNEDFFRATFR